jgi:hypothetical protein
MDKEAWTLLSMLNLSCVTLIRVDELEAEDMQLAKVRSSRNSVEYYFTSKASLLRYVLSKNQDSERVTYLDADLYFFSNPTQLDNEIGMSSVAIIEHRFSPNNLRLNKFGRFNAGWLSIRNDVTGYKCIEWWRACCLDWCYDRVEGDRYADQKYFDKMPEMFNATIVANLGANLAPWNIGNSTLSHKDDVLFVDGQPVIFFHFQGLKRLWGPYIESGLSLYHQKLTNIARDYLFLPYIKKWCAAEQRVAVARQQMIESGGNLQTKAKAVKISRSSFVLRSSIVLRSILRNLRYRTIFKFHSPSKRC